MKFELVKNIQNGCICAEDVRTPAGQLIIKKNTLITKQMITRLRFYNITSVEIYTEESLPEEVSTYLAHKQTIEQEYTEKLTSTEEYNKFQALYHKQVENLQHTLNDVIIRNAPLEETQFLSDVQELFDCIHTSYSLLSLIHDMHSLDDSTYAHCLNVSLLSRMVGTWLDLPEEELNILTLAGLFHDIGKCQIPDDILLKPAKLTAQEFSFIQMHSEFGYNILKEHDLDNRILQVARSHHERFDGSGYPAHLTSSQIGDFTSIVMLTDVYDAMTSNRCYRGALCPFDVIAMFEEDGFAKYSPQYLLPFLRHIAESYTNVDVLLSDNTIGRIILITENLTRPVIRTESGKFINLNDFPELYIQAIV